MEKKIMKTVLLFVALAMSLYNFAWCQAENELEQKAKAATASDVVGTWKMTYQVVGPPIKSDDLFFADYQIFEFFDDGYVKHVTSTKSLDVEDVKMYLETMPRQTTYSFVADGLLVIDRSQHDVDNIIISVITEDMIEPLRDGAPLLKKGNLILSYLNPNNQLYMQRYLKKVNLK